ncbi:MAG: hypothetical protein JWN04_5442 [Myxococcaceae bacterium]|nr:hypothetical protein [Myxococcaceae bacterium]
MPTTDLREVSAELRGLRARRKQKHKQGFALLLSLIAIAVLAILVTDLHETTGMSFSAATAERDALRAEYMAKSGLNLTRMLIGQEKNLRQLVAPFFQYKLKRPPPPMPVWRFADALLKPFADFDGSKEDVASSGIDVEHAEGLGNVHGTFTVASAAENGKINLNDPRLQDLASSQANVAQMFYSLLGGYQPSPQKYDPLFSHQDEKGRITTRLDLIDSVIDWWDQDTTRANFDPVLNAVQSGGGEDTDFYRDQPEPYVIRNAPFDTLEELRLVRGMTDDIWATFVEPDADEPSTRQISIYGAARVNPNEAEPSVMLARLCSFDVVRIQPLCSDPSGLEPLKFINLVSTLRAIIPLPAFSRGSDFVSFMTGAPDSELYQMLSQAFGGGGKGSGSTGGSASSGGALGGGSSSSLLFTPLVIKDPAVSTSIQQQFGTSSSIFTIEVTGTAGISQRRIRAVVNTDVKWTPPKPNAGKLPPLGVFAYYRID